MKLPSSIPYLFANGIQFLAPLILLPLLRNHYGIDSAGTYILITTLSNYLGLLGTLGVSDGILHSRLSSKDSRHPTGMILFQSFISSSAVSIIAITALWIFNLVTNLPIQPIILLGVFASPGVSILLITLQIHRADKRHWTYWIVFTCWLIAIPSSCIFAAADFLQFISLWLLATYLLVLFESIRISRPNFSSITHYFALNIREKLVSNQFSQSAKTGFPILAHGLAGSTVVLTDRFLLNLNTSPAIVAEYQMVYLIGLSIPTFLGTLNSTWSLKLFHAKDTEKWSEQNIEIKKLSALTVLLFGLILIFYRPIFTIALGSSYHSNSADFGVVLFGCLGITQILYLAGLNALYVNRKTKSLGKVTVSFSVAQGICSALLIPQFGMLGPIISLFIFQATQAFLVFTVARRYSRMMKIPLFWWFCSATICVAAGISLCAGNQSFISILVGCFVLVTGLCLSIRRVHFATNSKID